MGAQIQTRSAKEDLKAQRRGFPTAAAGGSDASAAPTAFVQAAVPAPAHIDRDREQLLAPAAAPPRRTPFGRACTLPDTRASVPARLRINPYGLTLNQNVLILFSSRIERERRCFMTLHNIAVSRSRTFTVTALQSRTKAHVFVRNL